MSDHPLPIKTLISNRCDELSLRPSELVRRCGYRTYPRACGGLRASLKAASMETMQSSRLCLLHWKWPRTW